MTIFLCLAVAGMAKEARAQFLQYTPPGGPEEPPESRQEQIEREISEADHHLGRIRIAPWVSLHDIAYVQNIFSTSDQEEPRDFTATVGAGFRAYLHNGPKAIWRAQVLPELVWWAEDTERRQLNGTYTLGFHGFFNRLTVEVRGGREQRQQIVTPEVPVPVSARRDLGEILAEVRLTHALYAFTASSITKQDNLVEEVGDPRIDQISRLDRTDRLARVGLRWRPREAWTAAVGAERSATDFEHGPFDRSNEGTAPVAEVTFKGRRLSFGTDLAARSLSARRGSSFVAFDKVTGSAAVTLGTINRVSGTFYANRNLLYSLSQDYPYLTDQRLGFALDLGLGQRTQVHFFVENGDNLYTAFDPASPLRQEDVTSYGASTNVNVGHGIGIGLQAIRSEFDSNLPGADRSYVSVGTTVNLLGGSLGNR